MRKKRTVGRWVVIPISLTGFIFVITRKLRVIQVPSVAFCGDMPNETWMARSCGP